MPDVVLTNVLTNAAHDILHPSEPTFTEGHKEEPIQTNSMISLIFALAFSFSRVAWRVAATHLSRLLSRHWESQGETLHQHLRIPAKSSWVSGETPVNVLEHILDTLHIESIRKLLFAQVSTGLAHSATYGICYLHSAWCAATGVTKQAFCKYKNLSHSSTHAKNRQDPVRRSQWTRTPFGSMPREFILLLVSVCLCMIHCSPDGNIDWDGSKSFMSVFPKESLLTMILRQTSTMDHDICIYCLINYLYLLYSFVKSFKLASETRSTGCKEARNVSNVCLDSLHNISGTQLIQSNVLLHADHPVLAIDNGALRRQSKWRKCRGLSNGYTSSTLGFHSHLAAKWQLQWWPSQAKWKLQQPKRTIRRQGAKSTDSNFPGSPEHSDSLPHLCEFMTF